MSHPIAALGLRMVLATIIYLATVSYWVSNTQGWESFGIFAASIVFGPFAALSLLLSMLVARCIANRWTRLVAHPPVTVAMFAVLTYVIVGAFAGMSNDLARDMIPFTGLLAVVAGIDTFVGHMLDGWVERRQALGSV